ncbi:hypothetical protein [Actinacidiphila paucisporea]|nr:hypothetical protein [Actinacidiphila paucisporea]
MPNAYADADADADMSIGGLPVRRPGRKAANHAVEEARSLPWSTR